MHYRNVLLLLAMVPLQSKFTQYTCAAKKTVLEKIAYTAEEKDFLKKFYKKYEPSAERCRPRIRASGSSFTVAARDASLLSSRQGTVACLLSGCKKIARASMPSLKAPAALHTIIEKNEIRYITNPHSTQGTIWYTPAGKKQALLLIKAFIDGTVTHYLEGSLLGYSQKDIKAHYLYHTKKNPVEAYRKDKVKGQAWIKENNLTIEEWFKEAQDRYSLQSGKIG